MDAWLKIRNEYINGAIGYRKLAQKHGVSFATLRAKAKAEKWVLLKEAQRHKVSTGLAQKTAETIIAQEVSRVERLLSLSDKLSDKLDLAIGELDRQMVRNKIKNKVIEYRDENAIGKPTREIIHEDETVEVVPGIIDRQGLQQLTTALKNIKDVIAVDASADPNGDQIQAFLKATKPSDDDIAALFAEGDDNETD